MKCIINVILYIFYISLETFLHMQNITVQAYVTIVCRDYIHCRRLLPTGYTRTQPLQHTSGYLLV